MISDRRVPTDLLAVILCWKAARDFIRAAPTDACMKSRSQGPSTPPADAAAFTPGRKVAAEAFGGGGGAAGGDTPRPKAKAKMTTPAQSKTPAKSPAKTPAAAAAAKTPVKTPSKTPAKSPAKTPAAAAAAAAMQRTPMAVNPMYEPDEDEEEEDVDDEEKEGEEEEEDVEEEKEEEVVEEEEEEEEEEEDDDSDDSDSSSSSEEEEEEEVEEAGVGDAMDDFNALYIAQSIEVNHHHQHNLSTPPVILLPSPEIVKSASGECHRCVWTFHPFHRLRLSVSVRTRQVSVYEEAPGFRLGPRVNERVLSIAWGLVSLHWLVSKARWHEAAPLLLLRGRHHDFTSDFQCQPLLSPALILRNLLSTHTLTHRRTSYQLTRSPIINNAGERAAPANPGGGRGRAAQVDSIKTRFESAYGVCN